MVRQSVVRHTIKGVREEAVCRGHTTPPKIGGEYSFPRWHDLHEKKVREVGAGSFDSEGAVKQTRDA